ncbi:MAG: WD40 repeat domain-containing protein, partial [Candidatus Cloacimonetes bacterium]|nr:WD40 repeat domain-containing protein [Candidatus Cloacimonadota bacterium]
FSLLYGATIKETMLEIATARKEILRQNQMWLNQLENEFSENPLFQPIAPTETDTLYFSRRTKGFALAESIQKKFIGNLWQKIQSLHNRLFMTRNISIKLTDYNKKTGFASFEFTHYDFEQETSRTKVLLSSELVEIFQQNPNSLTKELFLVVDSGSRITLARFDLITKNSTTSAVAIELPEVAQYPQTSEVNSGSFRWDGRYIAVASGFNVSVYDCYTNEKLDTYEHSHSRVLTTAFSIDGKQLATGTRDGRVRLFDFFSHEELLQIRHRDEITSLAFSPDGCFLAVGGWDMHLHIYELPSGSEVTRVRHFDVIRDVVFSPDGNFIATASNDDFARIFDFKANKFVHEFQHSDAVASVAFSSDGRWLATGSHDAYTRIFSLKTGKFAKRFRHNGPVYSALFSHSDEVLISGSYDRTIRFTNIETGEIVKQFYRNSPIKKLALSPDGCYLLSSEQENKAYLLRTLINPQVSRNETYEPPPIITATATFSEPSGNGCLDAGEKGRFTLKLRNTGFGPALGITILIRPEKSRYLRYQQTYLDKIESGNTVEVIMPIEAKLNVESGKRTFRFDFKELNGFSPSSLNVDFQTCSWKD